MRALLTATLALALALLPAGAALAASQLDERRIYTLAGGGTLAPRTGLPATSVRLGESSGRVGAVPMAGLPDGSVVTVDARMRPFLVGVDGRVRVLPRLSERGRRVSVEIVAAQPDGAILAAGVLSAHVHRLQPGAGSWSPVLRLRDLAGFDDFAQLSDVAGLPDGAVAVTGSPGAWRVTADGAQTKMVVPGGGAVKSLAALADGRIAVTYEGLSGSSVVGIAGADGRVRRLGRSRWLGPGFAALADGVLLLAQGPLHVRGADGGPLSVLGRRPGLGAGDGGPAWAALLQAYGVTTAGDGAVVVSEATSLVGERGRLDLPAYRRDGALVTEPFGFPPGIWPVLRVIVPDGTTRPVAAIRAPTFEHLAAGEVHYSTTFAGRATVSVRRARGEVARAEADVPAGDGSLRLPAPLPAGDYRVNLSVQAPNGPTATAHLVATTVRRLSRRRWQRTARRTLADDHDIGYYHRIGRCRRVSAREAQCQVLQVWSADVGRPDVKCSDIATIVLRPDGARAWRAHGPRKCRALGAR